MPPLALKYDRNVPRYTSYPTAPHFSPSVDAERYRSWLAALDPSQPLSLYFHIPFCDSMCWFCGCYTKVVRQYQPILDYLDVLLAEIALVARVLPSRFSASHLHWGGGSPTMLRPADWKRLVEHLRNHFDVSDAAELAVEVDPRDATRAYVEALADAGVNRVSIGVQDFDPEVQAAVNRIQPFEVVARVCDWLRRCGIERINLDLMYGLPHQDAAKVAAMTERALSLRPSRVALFGYAHVPWMKSHQKLIPEDALPGAEARWEQAAVAASILQAAGYSRVGFDHFARSDDELTMARNRGHLKRNFQGYTADDADVLIGCGASAIGMLPQGYVQNAAPLKAYADHVNQGTFPISRGIALTNDDRLRRDVIEQLMCRFAVDLEETCRRYGANLAELAPAVDRLQPLVEDALVVVDRHHVRVTEAGWPLVRLAAAAFDTYLDAEPARHSRAV